MDNEDYLWSKRHDVLYRVELSVLYHQKRERFFEACDKLAKALAVIGGSAALSRVASPDAVQVVAAIITVSSTLSLVFGFSDRSKRHSELVRNFRQLESDIAGKGERDFTETDLTAWAARERTLETAEPPALGVLVQLCQNELAIAQCQPKAVVPVPFFKRMFAHLFDFSTSQAT